MRIEQSILDNVKESLGLPTSTNDFDTEILMHINSAIAEVNQNGVGRPLVVTDSTQTWADLQDPLQTQGNQYFQIVPLFVTLSTKIIFDPPPPSTVEQYANNRDKLLWRLKIAYEEPYVEVTIVEE